MEVEGAASGLDGVTVIGAGAEGIGLAEKAEVKVGCAASGLDGLTVIELEAAGIGLTAKVEVKVEGVASGLDSLTAMEEEAAIEFTAKVVKIGGAASGLDGLTENTAVEGAGITGGLIENVNILPGAEGPATGARCAG